MNQLRQTPLPYKPLNRIWAKAEIFLGLAAAGVGLGIGFYSLCHAKPPMDWNGSAAGLLYSLVHAKPPMDWNDLVAGLLLFVLGLNLAMAGHRSHLYQSLNEQTNILLQHIQSMKEKNP